MNESQYVDLMMCLGFGLGSLFWSFIFYIVSKK